MVLLLGWVGIDHAQNRHKSGQANAALKGLPVGISSGVTIAAALGIGARPPMTGERIVAIVASNAEHHLSTELFAEI